MVEYFPNKLYHIGGKNWREKTKGSKYVLKYDTKK